ncbi:unnamed protein product [Lepidochelys olivacea]
MIAIRFTEWLMNIDKEMGKKKRKIAVILNCSAHPTPEFTNVKLNFLLPSTISLHQTMVEGVIHNLKLHYRKIMVHKFFMQTDGGTANVRKFTKDLDVLDAVYVAQYQAGGNNFVSCNQKTGFAAAIKEITDLSWRTFQLNLERLMSLADFH